MNAVGCGGGGGGDGSGGGGGGGGVCVGGRRCVSACWTIGKEYSTG